MKIRKLGEGLLLLPGSPSTLLVPTDFGITVVDPGYPAERSRELARLVSGLTGGETTVALTHSHSDHVAAVDGLAEATGARVIAPRLEACAAESPELRGSLTFGGRPPSDFIHSLQALPARVHETFRPPAEVAGLQALPTPGHSFGHVSYLAPSGVLYAGDCLFGDRLMRSVAVPYHQDYARALETLRELEGQVDSFRKVVPSHGPVVSGGRALELIEANLRALEDLPRLAREASSGRALGVEELAARVLRRGGADVTPSSVILACVTLRSMLSHLVDEGLAEAVADERGVHWRLHV